MERYLITQSLLSSWAYIFNCRDGQEEDAIAEFMRSLNREKTEPTEAILDGIAFEKEVYKEASGINRSPHKKWEQGIQKVASYVRGAQYQVRVSRDLTIGNMTFLCYGILDCLQAGIISDVKYKIKGFGSLELAGYYLDSPQHPMYFYLVPEAYEFQYLVSDGQDVYKEVYRPAECRDIRSIISEFIQSITEMGLLPLYKEKWLAL